MNNLDLKFGTEHQLFEEIVTGIIRWTPYLIGLLIYIILAYITFKVVILVATKVLKNIRPENATKKWLPFLELDEVKINFGAVILAFLRITLLLLLVIFGSELFGLDIISTQIGLLIGYFPRVLMSFVLVILALGLLKSVSKFIQNILQTLNITGARLIAKAFGSIILFMIIIIAIELLGIDTSIITTNLSIILGALMFAVALAIGFGSVEVVRRILLSFYLKKTYKIGQVIQLGGISGRILAMDGISVIIKAKNETHIIPVRELADARVLILEG